MVSKNKGLISCCIQKETSCKVTKYFQCVKGCCLCCNQIFPYRVPRKAQLQTERSLHTRWLLVVFTFDGNLILNNSKGGVELFSV